MQKNVRWMSLGCFLALMAIWCMTVAFGAGRDDIFAVGYLVLPLPSILCFAAGFFNREQQASVRWFFLGCFLILHSILIMTFASVTGGSFYQENVVLFRIGMVPLPILALISFAVGYSRRNR